MAPPLISTAEFTATEGYCLRADSEQSNFTKTSVLVSVLLHLALVLFLITSETDAPIDSRLASNPEPESIQISLLPANPFSIQEPLPIKSLPEVSIVKEVSLEAIPDHMDGLEAVNIFEAPPPSPVNELEQANDSLPNEAADVQLKTIKPIITELLPTPETIARTVRDVSREHETRFFSHNCSPLEEDESVRKCAPKSSNDYRGLEANAVYQAFNPSVEISRSDRVSGVVSSNVRGLSETLRGQTPEGLSDYLIEELEAGISHNVNAGNRVVQHMINMTDKSSAAAQARQVFDNPLLLDLKRAQQNPTRGVLLSPP